MQVISEIVNSGFFDEVWMVPCGERVDKVGLSSVDKRYEMSRLSLEDFFNFS
jgi:hypothetical protein